MNTKAILSYVEELEDKTKEMQAKISNLESENESLKFDVDYWKEKYEQEIQYRQDNFKMISEMEMYSLNEDNYH